MDHLLENVRKISINLSTASRAISIPNGNLDVTNIENRKPDLIMIKNCNDLFYITIILKSHTVYVYEVYTYMIYNFNHHKETEQWVGLWFTHNKSIGRQWDYINLIIPPLHSTWHYDKKRIYHIHLHSITQKVFILKMLKIVYTFIEINGDIS